MSATPAQQHELDIPEQRDQELIFAKQCLARFTYAISHELYSPITTLHNLLDMFSHEVREQLDTEGNELLDMILLSSKRTQDMAAGILDYSKSSMQLGEKSNVDCRVLVDQILEQLDDVVRNNKATIHIGELPAIHSSASALKQIFEQLISNALKFSPDDTPPSLSINARCESQGVEFIFSDSGIGINPEQYENVFGLFNKLHAKSDYEGAGLGLPICLQVINALDGRVWITTAPEGGAAFHVFLPT